MGQPAQAVIAATPTMRPRRSAYRLALAYGHLIYRLRWGILLFWGILLVASIPFVLQVGSVLKGGYSYTGGESGQAARILSTKLHQPASAALLVLRSSTLPVSDVTYEAEISRLEADLRGSAHLTGVTQGPVSSDGQTTVLILGFDLPASAISPYIADIQQRVDSAAAGGPARTYLTGEAASDATVLNLAQADTERAEITTMPVVLLVLLLVFGSLIAALMPLTLALIAVPLALALLYVVAVHVDISVFAENTMTIIGLGISIDYSLLMTRRFRDELRRGSVRDAVARTIATTGEAILFSGLCVILGFSGLFLIDLDITSGIAIGGMIIVGCAVLAAITLLPALLGILGERVNAVRVPLLGRPRSEADVRHGRWHALALAVMDHPVRAVTATLVIVVVLAAPLLTIKLGWYGATAVPAGTQPAQGLAILQQRIPLVASSPIQVIVQTRDGSPVLASQNLQELAGLTTWLESQPHVTNSLGLLAPLAQPGNPATSPSELVAAYTSGAYQQYPQLMQLMQQTTNGDTTVVSLYTNAAVDSDAGKALITALRAGDQAHAGGLRVLVGGLQAQSVDLINHAYGNFPRAVLFTLGATFLLLLLLFRSLLLPLKAVLMNLLSLGAAYGVLVFVFQWGNLEQVFHFTSFGVLDAITPLIIFAVLFGLSMDYEVFLLSRVREEWLRTRNNRNAVARGMEKTGGVITHAAILFAIVAIGFTFTTVTQTKELGLGMTVAVLVDATLVRTLLVPATMRLLGRWNWWFPGQPVPARSVAGADALDAEQFAVLDERGGLTPEEHHALRQRLLQTYLARLLPGLPEATTEQVAAGAELVTYAPGETIITQGATADRFYLIISGECDIYHTAAGAEEALVDHLTSGEYFGEIGLLRGIPRTATVRAASDSSVHAIAVNRTGFAAVMHGSGLAADDISGVMRKRLLELQSLSDA